MPDISEKALIDEVQRRLARKFAHVPPERVSTAIAQAQARFEQSPVRDFVPLPVERRAGQELAQQTALVAASS